MKYLYSIALLFLCIACNTTEKGSTTTEVVPVSTENEDDNPVTASAITWDSNLIVGKAMIWREEEKEGAGKWTTVHITNVEGFNRAPNVGDVVQVIPFAKDLSSIRLKITKTTPRDDLNEGSPQWHEVELEQVKDQHYFDFKAPKDRSGEYPGEVAIVYTSDLECTYVESKAIKNIKLPRGITLDLVKGAVDFDADGLPDALLCEFCCKEKSSAKDCEYFCSETYLKYDGLWRLIDTSQPM